MEHLLSKRLYRPIGIGAAVIFSSLWILQSKSYYVFTLYPVLFAAGSVKVSELLQQKHRFGYYSIIGLLAVTSALMISFSTPVLPIDTFVSYADIDKEENGRIILAGDYADMFGWEEQVQLAGSIYQSLSFTDRENCVIWAENCVIWAENYGEACAPKILGKQYCLPNPISRHGSFWLSGYDNPDAAVWISLSNERESVEYVFSDIQLVKIIYHKYAIDEENGIPLYLCRKPKRDIHQWRADYEPDIFN